MANALEIDVTLWLINGLSGLLPAEVAAKTPAGLETRLPFVRVVRVGGSDDGVTLDQATIVSHCFAATLPEANRLAMQVGTALRALRDVVAAGAVVTLVRTIGGPTWTPYGNSKLEQVVRTDRVWITAL